MQVEVNKMLMQSFSISFHANARQLVHPQVDLDAIKFV